MTKEELERYRECDMEMMRLRERIATVRAELVKLRSVIITDMPKVKGAECDRLEYLLDLKADLIAEYEQQILQCNNEMLTVETALHRMKDKRGRTLLSMRYLDGRTWEYIAERMGYDLRWVYRLHRKALDEIRHC